MPHLRNPITAEIEVRFDSDNGDPEMAKIINTATLQPVNTFTTSDWATLVLKAATLRLLAVPYDPGAVPPSTGGGTQNPPPGGGVGGGPR